MDCCREALMECGLAVKSDGRIVRAAAAELMPLLNAKIDRLMRLVKAYESRISEQQAEISRLKAELEED